MLYLSKFSSEMNSTKTSQKKKAKPKQNKTNIQQVQTLFPSLYIAPTNSDKVLSVIKKLSNNKSVGPASIPSKLLELFQTVLSKSVSLNIWRLF